VQSAVVLLQHAPTFRLQTSIGAQEVPGPAQALLLEFAAGQARWSVMEHVPVVEQHRPSEQSVPPQTLPKPCQTPGRPDTAQALVLVGWVIVHVKSIELQQAPITGHTDPEEQVVPLPRYTTVADVPKFAQPRAVSTWHVPLFWQQAPEVEELKTPIWKYPRAVEVPDETRTQ